MNPLTRQLLGYLIVVLLCLALVYYLCGKIPTSIADAGNCLGKGLKKALGGITSWISDSLGLKKLKFW